MEKYQLLSKLKLWLRKNHYANKAIYFLYDYSYGVKLSSEGMFGMQVVLDVLKLFYDKGQLIDPPDEDDDMFPSE